MHQSAPHHCRALLPRAPAPLRSSWWTPEALPPLPLTPSTPHRSLSRSPRSHAAVHHGRLANLAVAASSPLQASTAAATCTTAFASSCCTSRARSPKPSATGAPPPVSCRLPLSSRPLACVARPRRASSEQAADTYGCAWTHRCSPAPQTPTEWPPPAGAAIPGDPLLQIRVRDLARQFDESQGPNCEVSDSCE